MAPRDQLMLLIEAYADAKSTDNAYLQGLMAKQVSSFLQNHDIVSPVEVPEEIKKQALESLF